MDAIVSNIPETVPSRTANEDFLLREGLEVLANYRAITDDAIRLTVRSLIASLAVDLATKL